VDDCARVRSWFGAHGSRFGFGAGAVSCEAVIHLGGFVNRSYTVTDGRRRLHVKLGHPDCAPGLRRWAQLHRRLQDQYRAPRLLGVVEGGVLAGEALALVFEHVPGRPLDARRDGALLPEVLELCAALHADRALAAALPAGAARTCADDLVQTFVDRLRSDLAACGDRLAGLAFLERGFARWATAEVDALQRAVRADPALAAPAEATVHGDLHGGNVLVSGGQWCVLDWDDLHGRGDGALDALALLWPLLREGRGAPLAAAYAAAAGDPQLPARAGLYRRAMLLDEVIDSLADWVEADAAGAQAAAVRALKQAAHRDALAEYRRAYG